MKGVGTRRFMCVEPMTSAILPLSPVPLPHLPPLSHLLSFPLTHQCFAVHSLGWVEVPEEDLVPGKSSIAVNNCIQQLAQTRSRSRSQPPDGAWGEGQNMLMILKKDAMSLVNPLDHSLIHCQPLVHIRVWGVGSSKGR